MNVSKALVYRFVVSMVEDSEAQQRLLDELNVKTESAQHPLDERVPIDSLNNAHHRLAELTGDNFVSWRFGYLFELDSIGVLGLLWRHASNLEDMVALHVKFLGVLLDVASAELITVDGGKKVEWTPLPSWESSDPIAVQREFEAAIGFFSKAIQVMTGKPIMPMGISMKRDRPDAVPQEFEPYLAIAHFNSEKHSIAISDDDLARPLVSFNPHMLVSMEQYLESILSSLNRSAGFAAEVEKVVVKEFPAKLMSVDQLADRFHMSARSFQRKLVECGESYRDLMNRVKFDIAKQQLQSTDLSISEIGFLLGYAEPPAFIRFFKKRSGLSPTEFRTSSST